MELDNKQTVPVEVRCKCGKIALFVVRLNTVNGKFDVYMCDDGHEIRVLVKE